MCSAAERVGARAGKAAQDIPFAQAANLRRIGLHDRRAERHLSIAAQGQLAVVANREDRGRSKSYRHG